MRPSVQFLTSSPQLQANRVKKSSAWFFRVQTEAFLQTFNRGALGEVSPIEYLHCFAYEVGQALFLPEPRKKVN
jgi:hypothetical protein